MFNKLLKKTLIPSQIFGYTLTIFIGSTIVLLTSQIYFDIIPLISQETDVFKNDAAVISKTVSAFKTVDKEKIYFTDKEISELESQEFIKDVSKFNNANFEIGMSSEEEEMRFYTGLFFESIPNKYLDVDSDDWEWEPSLDFIPIIIPEDYLNLYNFGFAQSQGMQVVSKNTMSSINFRIEIEGNGKSKIYKSRIVGFSTKINSILVPENFLTWANEEFGREDETKTSRLLIEFNDPADDRILKFFNENNYSINKEKLEFSKIIFFFKSALLFVFLIALIIIFLSIAFILLSMNLIIQRNKELLINLYSIGYNYGKIAKFYQVLIGSITIFAITISMVVSNKIRNLYSAEIINFFEFSESKNYIIIIGVSFILTLVILFTILILNSIKKIVIPKKI